MMVRCRNHWQRLLLSQKKQRDTNLHITIYRLINTQKKDSVCESCGTLCGVNNEISQLPQTQSELVK